MHFLTCVCGRIKKTNKNKIICEGCNKKVYKHNSDYDFEKESMIDIEPNPNGELYKQNENVNPWSELWKSIIFKNYKRKDRE